MDELKQKITGFLKPLKDPAELTKLILLTLEGGDTECIWKDKELSEKARKDGNILFCQNTHDLVTHHKILQLYNRSIAFAPNGSEELAAAYGNKSALLRHVGKYPECIIEIDKALKNTKCAQLKVKLLCRKAECLTALGSSDNRSCIEKAKFIFAKASESEKNKKKMDELIRQTQSKVDADELNKPKKPRRVMESSKITATAENIDIWNCVKIEYNEKDGRHLVAARDFAPGEIVLAQRSYMNFIVETKVYVFCCHCWGYIWTAFPCDHCSWRVYCSERCKIEALNEYHDMECSVLVGMRKAAVLGKNSTIPRLTSLFLKMLKKAGSMSQLQKDLQLVDQCEGKGKGGLSSNELDKDYCVIYSLPFRDFEEYEVEFCIQSSVITLMGLAKDSSIFSKRYDFEKIDELLKDGSAVFAGALILKLCFIVHSRKAIMQIEDPCEEEVTADEFRRNLAMNVKNKTTEYSALETYGTLTAVRCTPNAKIYWTYTDRHVTYALSPIKKGSPIITSSASIYDGASKSERQAMYQENYGCRCECEACTGNWSDILTDSRKIMENFNSNPCMWRTLEEEILQITAEIEAKQHKINFPDPKLLSRTTSLVAEAWKYFPMPSLISFRATHLMIELLGGIHTARKLDLRKIDSCKT